MRGNLSEVKDGSYRYDLSAVKFTFAPRSRREPDVSSGWAPHVGGRGRGPTHCGGVCAWRDITRRLYRPLAAVSGRLRPFGRGAPTAASDQRERLLQFRAGARNARPARTAVPRGSANRVPRRRGRERLPQFRAAARNARPARTANRGPHRRGRTAPAAV